MADNPTSKPAPGSPNQPELPSHLLPMGEGGLTSAEALKELTNAQIELQRNMIAGMQDLNDVLSTAVGHYKDLSRYQKDSLGHTSKRVSMEKESIEHLRARKKAEQELAELESKKASHLMDQLNTQNMINQKLPGGKQLGAFVKTSQGAIPVDRPTIKRIFDKGPQNAQEEEIKKIIEEEYKQKRITAITATGAHEEVGIRDTFRRMRGQMRSGGGISPDELMTTARSLSLGRFLGPLAFLGVAPQLMNFAAKPLNTFQNTINSIYGSNLQLGQVSGEGWRAGVGARVQAFRGGLNPFDTISQQRAMETMQQVLGAGFSGRRRSEAFNASLSIIKDLGIGPEAILPLMSDAFFNGGESIKQITEEMKSFDDVAHKSARSVEEMTKMITEFSTQLRASGGGAASTSFATNILASVPRQAQTGIGPLLQNESFRNLAFGFSKPGALQGPWDIIPGIEQDPDLIRRALAQYVQAAPIVDPNPHSPKQIAEDARFLSQLQGSPVQGRPVPEIIGLITGAPQLGTKMTLARYRQGINKLRDRPATIVDQYLAKMSPKDRRTYQRLVDKGWNISMPWQVGGYDALTHKPGLDEIWSDPTEHKQLMNLRRDAFQDISGLLTPRQRTEFQKGMRTKDFSAEHWIQVALKEAKRRGYVDQSSNLNDMNVNTIVTSKITIDKNAGKKTNLNARESSALAQGSVQGNNAFNSGSDRANAYPLTPSTYDFPGN